MNKDELQVPGAEVLAGPQVPGQNLNQGNYSEALPTVSPEAAAEVAAENKVEAPQVADPEHSAPAEAMTETPVIDPMQPVGPN